MRRSSSLILVPFCRPALAPGKPGSKSVKPGPARYQITLNPSWMVRGGESRIVPEEAPASLGR